MTMDEIEIKELVVVEKEIELVNSFLKGSRVCTEVWARNSMLGLIHHYTDLRVTHMPCGTVNLGHSRRTEKSD